MYSRTQSSLRPACPEPIMPYRILDLACAEAYLRFNPDDGPVLTNKLEVVGFTHPDQAVTWDRKTQLYFPVRSRRKRGRT